MVEYCAGEIPMKMKVNRYLKPFSRLLALLSLPLILSACAIVPDTIQSENVTNVNPVMVRGHIANYKGQTVRWGGVITQVINNTDGTWIEVLAMDLSSSGRPSGEREQNFGRFIAKTDEFLDPEVYQEGYSFTVLGILTEAIDGKVGEYNYNFPVVTIQGSYLWPVRSYRYNYYPPIIPGYWYYGHHPYWRFGYGYYGFGVRFHHHYYPYYPIYGHLDRNLDPLPQNRRSGTVHSDDKRFWPMKANEYNRHRNGRNPLVSQNRRANDATLGHSRPNQSSVNSSSNRRSQSKSKTPRSRSGSSNSSSRGRSDSKRVDKTK